MKCLCIKRGIQRLWAIIESKSGFTEQSTFLVRCERILRSWNSEQRWGNPRSQSTLYCSESLDHAVLRFWIAAWHTEYYGYFRKRFLNEYLLEKDKPHAIIVHYPVPAECVYEVISQNGDRILFERLSTHDPRQKTHWKTIGNRSFE